MDLRVLVESGPLRPVLALPVWRVEERMTPCPTCGGTDFRQRTRRNAKGYIVATSECRTCDIARKRARRSGTLDPIPAEPVRETCRANGLPPTARPGYDGGLGWIGSPHIDPWLAWELDDAPEHWR